MILKNFHLYVKFLHFGMKYLLNRLQMSSLSIVRLTYVIGFGYQPFTNSSFTERRYWKSDQNINPDL